MAVRNEAVRLSLEDAGFTTGMAKAYAQTAALNQELERLDGVSVRANRSTSALGSNNGGIAQTSTQARRATADLNRYTGRLNLLLTAATTLGPALLPIGAVALPAVTSLTAGFGALVGAVGTGVLAFHGLGDALKALDDYQLDPTDEHLKKLTETFGQLSPAAQDLVTRLDSLEPVLSRLQESAQENMFPGLNEGLDQVLTLLPQVETVVQRIASEMGTLAADAGRSLANDADWQAFFDYIREDAAPTLDAFARATGNFAAGFASMLTAFRPLSDDFTSGLLDMSRGFREWAADLSQNSGFREFVDYIRENGPEVGNFFASLAEALAALAKAAAPWGAAILPVLTDAAKVFATIAESPIGPVIYDAAAAMLVFNRSSALLGSTLPRLTTGMASARTTFSTLRNDLGTMATTWATAGATTEREATRMAAAQERVRGTLARLAPAARTAAGVGGMMALVEGSEHADTALGALATTAGAAATGFAVGGPWGAAIGGGVGLLMSLAQTSDGTAQSVQNLTAAFDAQTGALNANAAAIVAQQLEQDGVLKTAQSLGVDLETVTQAVLGNADAYHQLAAASAAAFNTAASGGPDQTEQWDELMRGVNASRDALDGAGAAARRQAEATGVAGGALDQYGASASGAAGDTTSLETQVATLTQAMQAQRSAALSAFDATTQYGAALAAASEAAAKGKRGIDANTEAGRENRQALSQLAAAWNNQSDAVKNNVEKYRQARRDFIATATAMGVPEAAAKRLARRLLEIPKTTVIQVSAQTSQAEKALARIIAQAQQVPRTIRTDYIVNQINRVSRVSGGGRDADPSTPYASGGYVSGPGTSTSDSIPAWLSNGEYVVRAAAVQRYGVDLLDRLNTMRLADGGLVARGYASGGMARQVEPVQNKRAGDDVAYIEKIAGGYFIELLNGAAFEVSKQGLKGFDGWRKALRRMQDNMMDAGHIANMNVAQLKHLGSTVDDLSKRRLTKLGKALEKATKIQEDQTKAAKDALDAAQQQHDSLASSISGGLTQDLWSSDSGGVFASQYAAGSLQGAIAKLQTQIANAAEEKALTQQLTARGLSGPALQELLANGGLAAVRSAAGADDTTLRTYASLYGQAQQVTAQAASTGADAVYSAQISQLTTAYKQQAAELAAIKQLTKAQTKELKQVSKHTKEAPAKTGRAVSQSAGRARSKRR